MVSTLLQDLLTDATIRGPDRVALIDGGCPLSYAELEGRTNRLAKALVRGGTRRGDRVLVFAQNSIDAVVTFFGTLKADAIVVMISAQTRRDKLSYLVRDCRPHTIVCDRNLVPVVADAVQRGSRGVRVMTIGTASSRGDTYAYEAVEGAVAAETGDAPPPRRSIDLDLAAIIYTSGSTGEPKGVMMTHASMRAAAASITAYLGLVTDDVLLGALPLSFDYGLYQVILAGSVGAAVLLERSFTYPADVLARVRSERVTVFPGVPSMFSLIDRLRSHAAGPLELPFVRTVTNTGAALTTRHLEIVRRVFPRARVFSMYGLTECKRCSYLPPEDLDRKPGSVGIAIPNTELWVVNDRDERVGPGEVGQLVIRGATIMRGYWEKPRETAEKLRPGPVPGERVLYTGDLCRLDEDGYLYFVARVDRIIKSRGEKVAPSEVERVVASLPGVRNVVVVGVSDEVMGEAVKAVIEREEGSTISERDILSACARQLEPVMVPAIVEFVDELPLTSSGKVMIPPQGEPPGGTT